MGAKVSATVGAERQGSAAAAGDVRQRRLGEARRQWLEAVEQHHSRWLTERIEAEQICPWARPCRAAGRLWRRVAFVGPDVPRAIDEALLDAALALEQAAAARPADDPIEVALLVLPGLAPLTPNALEALLAPLRTAWRAAVGAPSYFVVSFHPAGRAATESPEALVRYWRRSPQPQLQFVHSATLDRIRGSDPTATATHRVHALLAQGLDIETIAAQLAREPAPRSVSAKVAEANHERWSQARARLDAADDAIHAAWARARAILPAGPDPTWAPTAWRAVVARDVDAARVPDEPPPP